MRVSTSEPQERGSSRAAVLCGLVVMLTVFALIVWQVSSSGPLIILDARLQEALAAWRRPGLVAAASWATVLGSTYAVAVLTIAGTLFLSLHRAWSDLTGLWIAMLGAGLSMLAVKSLVDRPRPDALDGIVATSSSFPSGNSVLAAAIFGILALIVLRRAPGGFWRTIVAVLAIVLPTAVAVSRLVLSVHWLSDVAAGLCLGAAWAFIGSLLAGRMVRSSPRQPSNRASTEPG